MSIKTLSSCGILALLGYLVYKYSSGEKSRRSLPPGPKPLPIIGNMRDFPPPGEVEFKHWLKLKDQYGPISSVTVLGMTMVFIFDKKAAHDLLELNSGKTAGRPTMVFANKLCGYERIILCQTYGSKFRRSRKLLHQELGTKASAARFQDVQELEVNRQLMRALKNPDDWLEHLQTTASATILKMVYGYTIEPNRPDALVKLIENMLAQFSLAAAPLAWIVDIIPILQHLPEGFPGASFKTTARHWRKTMESVAHVPYEFVQQQMAQGNHRHSYVSRLVEQCKAEADDGLTLSEDDKSTIMWTAESLYGAASDTTVITLTAFSLAMISFPEVQRKAQEEIDRVVGTDRLPSFEDRENLPYVDAVVKEAVRWWPIAPMGFPHTVTEDIEYEGYLIPKGAYLLPHAWWLLHDPEVYANPESFDPGRYLSPRNEPDRTSDAFGYGRRICPGRFFADASLYLNIAQSLAVFNLAGALDKNGNEIGVGATPKPGVLSYPTEFQVRATPRSPRHADLIKRMEKERPWDTGDSNLIESMTSYDVRK